MREQTQLQTGRSQDVPAATDPGGELSAYLRLRQIAEELQAAAHRNHLEVVKAASVLLGPTAAKCLPLRDLTSKNRQEAIQLLQQIQELLAESESILTASKREVGMQMKRVQQGKRALAQRRAQPVPIAPVRTFSS